MCKLYFLERPQAYNSIWVVGDDFVSETVGEFLQAEDEDKPYIRDKYDVKICCSTSLSLTRLVTARLHNNVANAISEQPLLPKVIIFVIDDDLIKEIHHETMGVGEVYKRVLKNLMSGVRRMILAHKEKLPTQSKKQNYPTILWSLCPIHNNMPETWKLYRSKFNRALQTMSMTQDQMSVLKLLKIWSADDFSFFSDRRFTAAGLKAFWYSMDSAFRHWHTFVASKIKKVSKSHVKNMTTPQFQSQHQTMSGREWMNRDVRRFKNLKSAGKHQRQSSSSPESYSTRQYNRHPTPPVYCQYDDY